MDYNNILNNKRKFNQLKNKTIGILNKATDKITEVTTTAVDSVVDTVKTISQQQAKVCIYEDVISVVNEELINATLENSEAVMKITTNAVEDESIISIEGIVSGLTATFDDALRSTLTSTDYIETIFAVVDVHYKYESGINYKNEDGIISLSIIPEAKEESGEKTNEAREEHVCDCETECENCSCRQQTMTLEYMDDEK